MQYLIGIDVGTTNLKALMFDETGKIAGEAHRPSPISLLENGGATFCADKIWKICCDLLTALIRQQEDAGMRKIRDDVAGIAVTGMGEAGVPLDQDGRVLYPAIAWFDPRTERYLAWWEKSFGADRMFAITNLRNQHIFTVNKLLWLKENEKEVFQKTKKWHCIPDFIAYRLTGCSAMDYSIATRTMMMNMATKTWSQEILDHAGISPELLPALVPSGTKVGEVTPEAAALCSLKAGIPVFAGGHDHVCGALAAGVFSPGVVLDSSGTCEEVLVSAECLDETVALSRDGFNAGCHVSSGQYYISGGIPASGASVDWFQREFQKPVGTAAHSEPGARGVMFLPHLRGSSSPWRDGVSKGAFLGVQARHGWEDFMQAVYEGVAFELRLSVERLLKGARPSRVVSIGGGTKNSQWLQIKADVLGCEIEVPQVQECTALGAALLAGIGAGVYKDERDAVARTFRVGKRIEPRQETQDLYGRLMTIYRSLYGNLYSINRALEF